MDHTKKRQLELALSRLGAKVSLAADELLQAEQDVQAASQRLAEIHPKIR